MPVLPPADLVSTVNRGTVNPGADDILRAVSLLLGVGGDETDVRTLRIDGEPWSKSRVRFSRGGHAYTPAKDRTQELVTGHRLRPLFPEPMTGNVALAAIFYRGNRQRIDADNMLKHVCDAATGVSWIDDSQVTAVLGVVELDPAHPRTVLAFAPHESTMTRGTDWTRECGRCGRRFVVDPRHSAGKYCGPDCVGLALGRVLAEPVACDHCGELYKRRTATTKYCSSACRVAALRDRAKTAARPLSRCSTCDRELSHHRGGRCRDCWRADPHHRAEPPA